MTLRADLKCIADKIAPHSKVLELGCSDGALLEYLARDKQADARGIELEQAQVSAAVQRGLSVIQGDADTDLKYYPNQCFDYMVSSQMIQATRWPKQVLLEMRRIAKHSLISVPNFGHWQNRVYLLLKGRMPVTSTLSYQWYETPNIHFSTVRDFTMLCKELGFTVEQVDYLDAKGKKLTGLKALFPNVFCENAVFLLKA